ncbi:MAG TPA: DUF1684 domain-containing protein [Chitinophagaceae bacterium]|nr:DUF1684 domain-containing protein [Chitinophagaceae bacterium]
MKNFILLCFSLFFICACNNDARKEALANDIQQFQQALMHEYLDSATTPLLPADRAGFKGIHFFPINLDYVVTAHFTRTADETAFKMAMSNKNDEQEYVKYGYVQFMLLGKPYKLSVYQSVRLLQSEQYKNYLAILFKDATSGHETYGGGRYIDLQVPGSDTLTINFNKAYQPYCAYTEGYSCPIPPAENYLPIRIEAGVKF